MLIYVFFQFIYIINIAIPYIEPHPLNKNKFFSNMTLKGGPTYGITVVNTNIAK
jgi:hypothetical protein